MKRDMDLLRKIIFEIESHESYGDRMTISIDGINEDVINYHIYLLHDAGLIQILETHNYANQKHIFPISLTWKGCEFSEAAKDDTRWNSAKLQLAKIGANVFEIMFRVLVETAADQLLKPK